jgi:hypothetical protein
MWDFIRDFLGESRERHAFLKWDFMGSMGSMASFSGISWAFTFLLVVI